MKGDKAQKGGTWRETNEGRQGIDKTGEADTTTQGDTWRETRQRQDRRGGHHHSGRHMKGDKWRETRHKQDRTHEGRQMKGDKAQTPPLRETHEGRQGTDKTGEADTTTQGDTWRETRHRQDWRGGQHHHSGRHMKGDKWRETRHRQDRRGGHHQSQRGGHILRKNWEPLNGDFP